MNKCDTDIKAGARDRIALVYRDVTGNSSIPEGKGLWSLCNDQTFQGSEIQQHVASGLITEDQFHGVDSEEKYILANRAMFPYAHWYHNMWSRTLTSNERAYRNAALVNLDTEICPTPKLIAEVALTVRLASKGTVIVINTVLKNPNNGVEYPKEQLPELLHQALREKMPQGIEFNAYNSRRTPMGTYIYRK